MQVQIVRSLYGDLHAHRLGCKDVQVSKYAREDIRDAWVLEATTVREVVTEIYPPSNFGYDPNVPSEYSVYENDVQVFSCASLSLSR